MGQTERDSEKQIELIELEIALQQFRLLAEDNRAKAVKLEWELGKHPTLTFTPVLALEYISVSFTVGETPETDSIKA